MNKKVLAFSILSLFLFSFMLVGVNAEKYLGEQCKKGILAGNDMCAVGLTCDITQNPAVCVQADTLNKIVDWGNNTLGYQEGGIQSFQRVFVFLLVFTVLISIFSYLFNWGVSTIISLVLSVFGVKFMSDSFLASIVAPSSSLTALIVVMLPFIGVWIITTKQHGKGSNVRTMSIGVKRIVWAAFLALCIWSLFNSIKTSEANVLVSMIFALFCLVALVFVMWPRLLVRFLQKSSFNKTVDEIENHLASESNDAIEEQAASYSAAFRKWRAADDKNTIEAQVWYKDMVKLNAKNAMSAFDAANKMSPITFYDKKTGEKTRT